MFCTHHLPQHNNSGRSSLLIVQGNDKGKAERQVGAVAMDEDVSASQLELAASSVATLQGHQGPVYTCAWSPTDQLLASR
jgi:hypothetical protein